jgi:hypothetical protein
MAMLRSRGEVKFMSSTIVVPFFIWVEQCMALTQKETLPSTNYHNGSRKGHFWITCRLHTVSCLIETRVVIRPEGHFFTRILTVELQWDGLWGKTGHMGSNCPTTCQDMNSSNGCRWKQGFNSGVSSKIMGWISKEMSPLSEVSSEIRQSHWVVWRTSGGCQQGNSLGETPKKNPH